MRRAVFLVLGLVAAIYMAGGMDGFRMAGTRVRRWFAPSQQEIQRASVDSAVVAAVPQLPPVPERLRNTPLTQPLSVPVELGVGGGIFVAALLAMYLTGRSGLSSRA